MADQNKVKFGIKNCHYAKATIAADGSATYKTPVAIPGAVSLALDPQGENTPFYADNIVYYTSAANSGYEGDLELAYIPDQFRKDILGEVEDANGVIYEDADAPAANFALLFEFDGDKNRTRHVMYNCTATRPTVGSNTKTETIEPQTESMTIRATTIYVPGIDKNVVKAKTASGDAKYATWNEAVYQPAAAGA